MVADRHGYQTQAWLFVERDDYLVVAAAAAAVVENTFAIA